jgi:hypothetical protein
MVLGLSKGLAAKRGKNQGSKGLKARYDVGAEGVPWVPLFLADYRPMAVCARPSSGDCPLMEEITWLRPR